MLSASCIARWSSSCVEISRSCPPEKSVPKVASMATMKMLHMCSPFSDAADGRLLVEHRDHLLSQHRPQMLVLARAQQAARTIVLEMKERGFEPGLGLV